MSRHRFLPSYRYYEAEGESSVTLENTADRPLRNYRIYGNTVDGVSCGNEENGKYVIPIINRGKNLCSQRRFLAEISETDAVGYKTLTGVEANYEYIAIHPKRETAFEFMKGEFKENTQYTISFTGKVADKDKIYATGLVIVYTDGTQSLMRIEGSEWKKYSLTTIDGKTVNYIRIYYYMATYGYYANIQIEQGKTVTPYEGYVLPIEKNIYLDKPLTADECIDFIEDDLPEIQIDNNHTNIFEICTKVLPSKVWCQYYK